MTSVIGKFFTCRVLLIGIYDDALGMGFRVSDGQKTFDKSDISVSPFVISSNQFFFEDWKIVY